MMPAAAGLATLTATLYPAGALGAGTTGNDAPKTVTGTVGGAIAATATPAARPELDVRARARHVVVGGSVKVRGRVTDAGAHTPVRLQMRSPAGRWVTVARSKAGAERFTLRWRPQGTGTRSLRVKAAGMSKRAGRARVYRRALASWYGPGLYGNKLACGGRLSAGTLGVAHKSLPCGTKVTLRHGGNVVRVPVVDRGPYVGAREFDLTSATRSKLRFSGTGTVLTTR